MKLEPKTRAVTGSARKAILSDLVTWSGTVTSKDADLVKAYDALKVASDKVKEFLVTNRIPENNITMSAITTSRRFHQEIVPSPPPSPNSPAPPATIITTDSVESYTLTQSISINSTDMERVPWLAEATKDATARAEQIVENAHGRLGKLVEARMGVMQINPKGVFATSAEGINDTTSYEKEITAVVSVRFEVR